MSLLLAILIHVTNLNDTGAGSLRACMEAQGSRECVFDVAGDIYLSNPIVVTSPSLTVKGETAPAGGIHIKGARLEIKASDVTLQHFSVRPGDGAGQSPAQRDGVVVWGANNVTLQNMSLTHAIDENFSTYQSVQNLRVLNTLIAEGLNRSIHPENEMRNGEYIGHSMGALIDVGGSSVWYKNVIANNLDRNIRVKSNNQVEFVNNYVFNWGRFSGSNMFNLETGSRVHFIGNVYKRGGSSVNDHPCIYSTSLPRVFGHSNICPAGRIADIPLESGEIFPSTITEVTPPEALLNELLYRVGARPWDRSPIDERILGEVVSGIGSLKDCIESCDTNPDGSVDVPVGQAFATPSPAPTVAMCQVVVPCVSLTPLPTAVPTATRTPTPLAPGDCENKFTQCRNVCEECQRYATNRISKYPYNIADSCDSKLNTCKLLCENCRKL